MTATTIVIFLHFCTRGSRDNTPSRGVIPGLAKILEGQIGKNITIVLRIQGSDTNGVISLDRRGLEDRGSRTELDGRPVSRYHSDGITTELRNKRRGLDGFTRLFLSWWYLFFKP